MDLTRTNLSITRPRNARWSNVLVKCPQPLGRIPPGPGQVSPLFRHLPLLLLLAAGALLMGARAQAAPALQDLPAEFDISTVVQSPSGHGKVRLNFNTQASGGGYSLLLGPNQMLLTRKNAEGETRLASSDGEGLSAAPVKITVQRRAGRIYVLAGPRLMMSVEDNTYSEGSAGVITAEDGSSANLRLQPVEALYFSDDFMRQPDEKGEWTYDKGSWQIETIGNVQRGANPFSLKATPGPVALATTGYAFWSNYSFEAAVKGSPETRIGICVDVQDNQNYYLLQWEPGAQGALAIVRVQAGKPTVLAQRKGGFIPNLWYHLGLRTAGGRLVAEVDHQQALSVEDTSFGAGKIGLYGEGGDGHIVYFDSILARPGHFLYDDFPANNIHHWQVDGEKAVGGDPGWQNYTITSQVTGSNAPMAVTFRYQNPKNYYVFNWGPASSKLIAVVNGQHKLLSEADRGIAPGETHTVQVGGEDGYIWAAIDGKRVVEGLDFSLSTGRAAFEPATVGGRNVKAVSVWLMDPPEPTDALPAEFTNVDHHKEMGGWAGPLNAWETANFGKDSGYWHKGNLYGNLAVKVPLIPQDLQDGQFGVVLNGDGKTAESGYEINYTASTASGINLELLRNGEKVASGHLKAPSDQQDQVSLDVYRQGRFIYAGIGSSIALRYMDPQPLDGYSLLQPVDYAGNQNGHSRLGLIVRGATPLDIPDITVTNRHIYAETFHLAPVNWRPQSGEWEVTRRWACQPGWTWYGGKNTGYAVNWFKRPLLGDQSIDYYSAAMMAAEQDAGTEAWRDLNCAFCSDGVNLFSGYTLIVGGWNGTTTRLYKKGKQVAESNAFYFPPQGVAHRLWFDTHIVKQGGAIHVVVSYVDETGMQHLYPLIDYTDPSPLSGGFVSFWTYDNGIMISRAVLSSQENGAQPLYTSEPTWLAQVPDGTAYPKSPEAGLASLEVPHPTLNSQASNTTKPGKTPAKASSSTPEKVAQKAIAP